MCLCGVGDYGEGGEGSDEWEDCEVEEVIGEEVEGEVIMDESEESRVTVSFSIMCKLSWQQLD